MDIGVARVNLSQVAKCQPSPEQLQQAYDALGPIATTCLAGLRTRDPQDEALRSILTLICPIVGRDADEILEEHGV